MSADGFQLELGHATGRKCVGPHGVQDLHEVVDVACDPEVGRQDPLLTVVVDMSEHSVPLVRLVESTRDGGDDTHDLFGWYPRWEPVGEQSPSVEAVDEVHLDPRLAFVLTSVMHAHDVWMPKC